MQFSERFLREVAQAEEDGVVPIVPAAQPEPEGERQEVRCKWCAWKIRQAKNGGWHSGGSHLCRKHPNGAHVGPHEPSSPSTDTEREPIDYWRCFHCDFHTTDRKEAEAHFGDIDDAEEFKPICKWWAKMDEAERRSTLQDYIRDFTQEQDKNAALESEITQLKAKLAEARIDNYNSGLASALNVVDTVAGRFDRDTETMGALYTIQEAIRALKGENNG